MKKLLVLPLTVSAGGTLVLDNGAVVRENLTRSGVTVIGGMLEMRDGSSVTENGDSGIWMKGAGGKFTMNGGTISGNDAAGEGGGVAMIGTNNEFIMTGGTISGNTASHGGGLYLQSGITLEGSPQIGTNKASGAGPGWIYNNPTGDVSPAQ
jgi:hypothetical protein